MNSIENSLYPEGEFSCLNDFYKCDEALDNAKRTGRIKVIHKPDWYRVPNSEIGQAMFYEDTSDNSVWCLLVPERSSKGYWK